MCRQGISAGSTTVLELLLCRAGIHAAASRYSAGAQDVICHKAVRRKAGLGDAIRLRVQAGSGADLIPAFQIHRRQRLSRAASDQADRGGKNGTTVEGSPSSLLSQARLAACENFRMAS